jgi:hypothetical protein
MAKNLINWINEIKNSLAHKKYTQDIPLDVFRNEFMILSGYNRQKVVEWVSNFEFCGLININDDKVNFLMK